MTERIVLDTNVFISGLLSSTSVPAKVVEHVVLNCQLVATSETQQELVSRLLSPKFDRYVSRKKREELLLRLAPVVELVERVQIVHASRDPDDDKFLEAAVNGRADVLVSGDKDLLVLHPFMGVAILTPADYLARVEKGE